MPKNRLRVVEVDEDKEVDIRLPMSQVEVLFECLAFRSLVHKNRHHDCMQTYIRLYNQIKEIAPDKVRDILTDQFNNK
jgi:hypothetical protein